ncbi:MAG: hypothetical protein ABIJ96_05645 [Elusimicrobiota bacterium]
MRFLTACAFLFAATCMAAVPSAQAARRPSLLFSSSRLELSRALPWYRRTAVNREFLTAPQPRTAFESSPMVTLAQFFIDDVPVARIGGFEIRFKIILE